MKNSNSIIEYHVPTKLNADLAQPAIVHSGKDPWTPSQQAGVERRFLERDGGEVARASSVVRYAANSSFPAHIHDKGEEYVVLSGVFSDEHGDFAAGSYVRNPPGSRHTPFTKDGCVIFVKLRQFEDTDQQTVRLAPNSITFEPTGIDGLTRAKLFERPNEKVALENFSAGTQWIEREKNGGEEIFVLNGELAYGTHICEAGTWLRIPAGAEQSITAQSACQIWTKRGHLPPSK